LLNKFLAVGYTNWKINIFDTVKRVVNQTLIGHTNRVNALVVLPNGDLASGSTDRSIRIWDIKTGTHKAVLTGQNFSAVFFLSVLPNQNLVSGHNSALERAIRVWNVTSTATTPITTINLPSLSLFAIAALRNGNVAVALNESIIRIWDINTRENVRNLTGHTAPVRALLVLLNGDLVSGSNDRTIRIWNVNTGAVKTSWTAHTTVVRALDVLLNGDIVSSSNDKTIRIWDANTYISSRNITGHTDVVFSLAALRNGLLASAGNDSLRLWNLY